jgi:lipoprotein-anchoring transpeptidase ErfK/SrfK
VSKTANLLTVTDNGKFFKRYRVGTGQFSKTPVGEFKITSRIKNPPWYRADGKTIPYGDPENILGTHWLGLNVPGYGIHGTWETNSIGRQSSAGCIRLLNDDIAELYVMLPVDTPVTIHD